MDVGIEGRYKLIVSHSPDNIDYRMLLIGITDASYREWETILSTPYWYSGPPEVL